MIKPKVGDYIFGSTMGDKHGVIHLTDLVLVGVEDSEYQFRMSYVVDGVAISDVLPMLKEDRFATDEEILIYKLTL